jgi:hypothetical protein
MSHTLRSFEVTNADLFNLLNVEVSVCGDNVAFSYVKKGKRQYHESWGEFGPNDFKEFGFRVKYTF